MFVALWVAAVDYARERRQFGELSYVVVRDELENSTFLRYVLFVGDVANHSVIAILACATLVAIIRSFAVGHLGTPQVLVHIVTLAATATGAVLVAVTDSYFGDPLVPWEVIATGVIAGLRVDVGGPAERSGDHSSQIDTATDPETEASTVESVGRWAHQKPGRGRTLTVLAWAMGALGLLMLFSGSALYKIFVSEAEGAVARLPLWIRLLIMAAVWMFGALLFGGSSALLKRGRQHRHRIIPSFEELAGERYLLYLRPFALDSVMALPPTEAPGRLFRSPFELPGLTREEFIVRQFHGLGRIVAIGQPGERLPEIGAERGYLPVDDWQDTVSRLLDGAHAAIMTAAPGPGTMWEFTEALRTVEPTRLLLLVHGDADYNAFREAAAQEYATRSSAGAADVKWPPLPQLPDILPPAPHPKELLWDFPLKGILSFDHQWRPQFTRFPPTVPRVRHVWTIRRLVRRELKPALDPVSKLPPASPFV
ncbi:hypothetical protein [Streptomyces sp. NPDC048638]|uniref:hypothetical protein n=1 Tax=Streptomyces sp. NPDC048638 TaxID=3365580 RepID=UPI00371A213D